MQSLRAPSVPSSSCETGVERHARAPLAVTRAVRRGPARPPTRRSGLRRPRRDLGEGLRARDVGWWPAADRPRRLLERQRGRPRGALGAQCRVAERLAAEQATTRQADHHPEARVEPSPPRTRSARNHGSAAADGSKERPEPGPRSAATRSSPTPSGRAPAAPCPSRGRGGPRPRSVRPSHSSSTDRSVGSWTSTIRIPAPIACGGPPGRRSRRRRLHAASYIEASIAAESWASIHARTWSRPTSREKPTHTEAPDPLRRSATPRSCRGRGRALARRTRGPGWKWTGRRWPASSSLTSSAGSAPSERRARGRGTPPGRPRSRRARASRPETATARASRRRSCSPP